MADVQTQERAGAERGPGPSQEPGATPAHPVVSMVEGMVSAGRHDPAELAAVLAGNPFAYRDILALLHRLIGNGAVQAILTLMTGGGGSTGDGAAPAEEPKAPEAVLGPVRVTARRLRVRRSPTTKGDNIVGKLRRDTVVTALAHEGAWIRIEHRGETAYIHGDYVEAVDKPSGKGPKDARPSAAGEEEEAEGGTPEQAQGPDAAPTPTPTPTPTTGPEVAQAPDPTPVITGPVTPNPTPTTGPEPEPGPAVGPKTPEAKGPEPTPVTPDVPSGDKSKGFFEKVYTAGAKSVGFQQVQVFVSPGGLTATPDVFLHFHGHRANYKLEGGPEDKTGKGTLSGIDLAEQAMRQAKDKNTIAILPQGVIGENAEGRKHDGGYMAALQQGLPTFLDQVLSQVAADLGMASLAPGQIGISGHSAGGFMGVHDALGKAGELADTITDVTLMDTSYSSTHFKDTAEWMLAGKPGKNVRIIGTKYQITDGKAGSHMWGYFSEAALKKSAKKHGFTVVDAGGEGEKRDDEMTVVQHSRVMNNADVQADILILQYVKTGKATRDHSPLRDEVLDDAILSIGEGAAGNDAFGNYDRGVLDDDDEHADHEVHEERKDDDRDDEVKEPAPEPEHKVEDAPAKDPAPVNEAPKEKKSKDEPKKPKKKKEKQKKAKKSKPTAFDEYGNPTERVDDRSKRQGGERTFSNPFTVIRDGALYSRKGRSLKKKLPKGTEVHVGEIQESRAQIISAEYSAEDDVWIDFTSLGGNGSTDAGLGNEKTDPEDKLRADKIREGLPAGRNPGKSPYTWRFSNRHKPSMDGVALDGSLMAKVHALMEWAIANDMVTDHISIGSGMRSPKHAHYMCVRYELANLDRRNKVSMEALQALPGGRDEDGNKWYEPGWTKEQVIEYAKEKIKKEKAKGKPAAAGYNFGDSRRLPLALNGNPGVSRHCSGHAVDVDIPWRSAKDPEKQDLWGWEHIYHQFGLTRPLHRDRASSADEESWHVEETGKALAVEGEAAEDEGIDG